MCVCVCVCVRRRAILSRYKVRGHVTKAWRHQHYNHANCIAAVSWDAGWVTFVNGDNGTQPASAAAILSRESPAATGISIAGNRPVGDYVSFTSLGHARRHDGALQMGTFTICRHGETARKVVLANSGRVRVDVTQEACP